MEPDTAFQVRAIMLEVCCLYIIPMFRRPSSGSVGVPTSSGDSLHNGHVLSITPKQLPTKLTDATLRRPSGRSTSSSQKLDVLANLSDVDPDELFTKHTVSEVKTVQQRLR